MRTAVPVALLVAIAVPGAAPAATFRSGDEVLIPAGETIADDLYVAGGRVRIEGAVTGDLVVAAGEADLRGTVGGDLLAAGGTVRIDGAIAGTARVGAGDASLAGSVGEDLVVAGGSVVVGPDARIGRDLVAAGGTVVARGAVGRNARVGAGAATLAGPIPGDADLRVQTLAVEAGARIGGRLQVASVEEPRIAPEAIVAGGLERTAIDGGPSPAGAWVLRFLRSFVAFAALGLLLLALTRAGTARAVDAVRDAPLRDLALGLGFLVAAPIVGTLVFLLGLVTGGWWIGLLLLAAFAAVLAAGVPVVALALGGAVLRRLRRASGPIAALLVGALVLALVGSIPVLGPVAIFLAALVGAGAWLVVFVTAGTRHVPPAAEAGPLVAPSP